MTTDVKHPAWLPRPLRPAPVILRRGRAFARDVFGDELKDAWRIPGWLHPDQAVAICYIAHLCPAGAIVEIGSFKGKSTVFLARGMKATNTLHAIDPHLDTSVGSRQDRGAGPLDSGETSWATFNRTLETWGIADRVNVIRSRSHDARAGWEGPIAMLWIDGDHSYEAVREDIDDWTPLVVPGGFAAFHDTHHRYPSDPPGSVRRAIRDSGLLSRGFETYLELRNTWILHRPP